MELFRGVERMLYGRPTAESKTYKENTSISELLANEIKRRNGLPLENLTEFLDNLKSKHDQEKNADSITSLEKYFLFKNSLDYTLSINKHNPEMNDVMAEININEYRELLSVMLDFPELYRFHTGLLLSGAKFDSLAPEIQQKLKPRKTKVHMRPKPFHKKWYLCDSSELFLDYSIKEKCVMTVGNETDNLFLMKFHGFLGGICLQNFISTEGRIFIKGNWYLPTDVNTRDSIEKAFKADKGRIDIRSGNWALMKSVKASSKMTAEEQIQKATYMSNTVPEQYDSNVVFTKYLKHKYSRAGYLSKFGKRYPENQYDQNQN